MATTLVLADDHPVVRKGLRAVLRAEQEFELVGEVADGLEAVRAVERLKPHVLIVDVLMPALNGIEVTRQVTQRLPATRVIVLSMYDNEAYVQEALRNGASGYVLKDSTEAELVEAVKEVAGGRIYLSARLSRRALEAYARRARDVATDAHDLLTTREREVLQLAAEGNSNPAIAAKLFISVRTVETHRANVMHKLGLQSQTDLIRYAFRRGILKVDN